MCHPLRARTAHGWNGEEFHRREQDGFPIAALDADGLRPDRDALEWHLATRFRAA